jgi:hypothetical protein
MEIYEERNFRFIMKSKCGRRVLLRGFGFGLYCIGVSYGKNFVFPKVANMQMGKSKVWFLNVYMFKVQIASK